VRLPKAILDQLQISEKLELEVENQRIVLKPIHTQPRLGWADAFKNMASLHEDDLVIKDSQISDGFEWEW
jgi:antitoxin MazE